MPASRFDELSKDERAKVERVAAKLAHDVGKYVAMTARNLPREGPIAERIVASLVRDLYALEADERASAVLARLAAPLVALVELDGLAVARARLEAIDALEPEVRRGDPSAVRRACDLAREVEESLRAIARQAREAR